MSNDHLFTLRTYDAHQKEKPRNRTLKQWNEMGYRVLKGMHAVSHDNNGEALFSRTQVVPRNAVRYGDPNGQDSWESIGEHPEEDFDAMDIPY